MAPRRKVPKPRSAPPLAPQVYRPAKLHNLLVALAACLFLALAAGSYLFGGSRDQYLAYPMGFVGIFLALIGAARFRTEIVVSDEGLSRSPWLPMGFHLRWEEVAHWHVRRIHQIRLDRPDVIAVHIVFVSDRRPIEIAQEDVSRPGFDPFLRDLRRYIGGRER